MGVTVKQASEQQLLSKSVLDIIPAYCECGADIEFTESFRQVYCSNPKCYYKIASRLESMAKKLRGPNGETCDGWGEANCLEVCKQFKLRSPFQAFLLKDLLNSNPSQLANTGIAAFEKRVESLCNPALRKVELWKIAELAGIPGIESVAYKIFGGYSSFEYAYNDIELKQVPFIADKLNLKSSDTSVMAASIYKSLIEYKDELLFAEGIFDITRPSGDTLYICITGGVQGYKNKQEFIQYLNNKYSGKINAMLMNSVTKQIDILVADGDTNSNKFKSAVKINNTFREKTQKESSDPAMIGKLLKPTDLHPVGEKIFIGTGTDVLRLLSRVYGEY